MSPACTLHNFTINPISFMRLSYKLVDTVRVEVPIYIYIYIYKFPGVDNGRYSNIILGTEAVWHRKLIPGLQRNVLPASSG